MQVNNAHATVAQIKRPPREIAYDSMHTINKVNNKSSIYREKVDGTGPHYF